MKTNALAAKGLEGIMYAACLTVLTVLPSVCTHCGPHQLNFLRQNRARKLKQDLQNIWRPICSRFGRLKESLPLRPKRCLLGTRAKMTILSDFADKVGHSGARVQALLARNRPDSDSQTRTNIIPSLTDSDSDARVEVRVRDRVLRVFGLDDPP